MKNILIVIAVIIVLLFGFSLLGSDSADDVQPVSDVQNDEVVSNVSIVPDEVVTVPDEVVLSEDTPVVPSTPTETVVDDVVGQALTSNSWLWKETISGSETVTPVEVDAFVLTFDENAAFSATTDCNSVGGSYQSVGDVITFGQMMMTEMFCEDSQEGDFVSMLAQTQRYTVSAEGNLVLGMMLGGGDVIFTPVVE